MTDETWALTVHEFNSGQRDAAFMVGSGIFFELTWPGGTLIGATAGAIIPDPAQFGLDFVLVPAMAALVVGMWKGASDLLPWGVAALVAVVASVLSPGQWYILLG
jgi:predicted branched-subunit amino acid permease